MTEETMNAVGILVTRTVMVEGQYSTTIASEEQRGGKTRWSCADNDAFVQLLFSEHVNRRVCSKHTDRSTKFPNLNPSCAAFNQPVETEQYDSPNDCQHETHQKARLAQIASVINRTSIAE